jgi:hypothetical protein
MPLKRSRRTRRADPASPEATLSAALYTEAKKPDGAIILVERGMMKARPQRQPSKKREGRPAHQRAVRSDAGGGASLPGSPARPGTPLVRTT